MELSPLGIPQTNTVLSVDQKNLLKKSNIQIRSSLLPALVVYLPCLIYIRPSGNEGEWQAWGGWSQCTSSCGEGLRVRARGCSGSGGGDGSGGSLEDSCPGDSTETEECISAECPGIVDGDISPFLMVFFN